MAYSRYGSQGKGLSDRGYARWVTKRAKAGKATVIKNPASYLMGMARIGDPVGWAGKSEYTGSNLEAIVQSGGTVPSQNRSSQAPMGASTTGFGGGGANILGRRSGAPGGRGRGIGWAFGGKPMGLPPGEEAGGGLKGLLTVGGLAYVVLKVLL